MMGMKKKEEQEEDKEDNILFLKESTWTMEEEKLILTNVLKPSTKFAKENPKIILEGAKSDLHRHPFWKERGQTGKLLLLSDNNIVHFYEKNKNILKV
jgi:hypothetical protein